MIRGVPCRFYALLLVFTCTLCRVCLARAKSLPTFRRHARAPATLLFNPYSPLCTLAVDAVDTRLCTLRNVRRQPIETFVETLAGGGARGLNEPVSLAQRVQTELIRDLRRAHRVRQILLVGEHQQHRIPKLIFVQHAVQLIASFRDAIAIVAIHNKDQTLSVLKVMSPERANLILSTDVPHRERNVLVLHGLDVETDRRNRRHDLTELELVQDGRLTGGVETNLRRRRASRNRLRQSLIPRSSRRTPRVHLSFTRSRPLPRRRALRWHSSDEMIHRVSSRACPPRDARSRRALDAFDARKLSACIDRDSSRVDASRAPSPSPDRDLAMIPSIAFETMIVAISRSRRRVETRATHHENAHLLLGEEALEKLGERDAHGDRGRASRARVGGRNASRRARTTNESSFMARGVFVFDGDFKVCILGLGVWAGRARDARGRAKDARGRVKDVRKSIHSSY